MGGFCSNQSAALLEYARAFMTFQTESEWAKRGGGPAVVGNLPPPKFDFVTGKAHAWKTAAKVDRIRVEYDGTTRIFDERVTAR